MAPSNAEDGALIPSTSPASPAAVALEAAYHVAACGAVALAAPAVLLVSLARPELRAGLTHRLGLVPRRSDRPAWFQAASVGEVRAFAALAQRLAESSPHVPLALSVTTAGGLAQARSLPHDACAAAFRMPLDAEPIPRVALARMKPRAFVSVETEIWPNLLRTCTRLGVPAALVNGRISDRSFPRYLRVRPLVARALGRMAVLAMRTDVDAERVLRLGAPEGRVTVTGDLKFDAAAAPPQPDLPWTTAAGLDQGPWIVFASTAPGEEEMVLEAWAEVRARVPGARAVLAPRRPESFEDAAGAVARRGIPCVRRSLLASSAGPRVPAGGVLVLDTLGELARVYRHAEAVFVGGSLVPRGGHNLLEPAAAGRPVLFGPHVDNFRDAEAALLGAGGGLRVTAATLGDDLVRLLEDSAVRTRMGRAAAEAVASGRGAAQRTAELLAPLLEG